MRVFRCFTEKRSGFDIEAQGLGHDLRTFLGITSLTGVRLFNRYDIEGITEDIYTAARTTVFSEPQIDFCFDETLPSFDGEHWMLAVEALPGQYDQRADSCAQCIQILTCEDRPTVRAAKVYVLYGTLTDNDKAKLRSYLINPVEAREASITKPETLKQETPAPKPEITIVGFITADDETLSRIHNEYSLAMDMDDVRFMQAYFHDTEKRDPTRTEIKLIDTYWSDHCRHTTFLTRLENVKISDPQVGAAYDRYLALRKEVYGPQAETRPQTLMDIATIAAKTLRRRGLMQNLDVSEEINACSIHINARVMYGEDMEGVTEDWLLMFKNETHNHPTEIEPYGGAATCIGGAIRDPLSGRAYVYQAMRVTGAADPRVSLAETIPGKLPQRKLTVTAAQGYSSYGNQIGLTTGLVHEVYHPGYMAKRMEVGAVVGAVRAANVVRETPTPGDKIILLGGRTGRDGIGGATGSSKSHNDTSLVTMASEVQKGNAPEERKIQRLFLDSELTHMIKRCNDFGAGGVSVAVGELADGLDVNLSLVRKKYEGLDATEIAISESQERMAVVVAPENVDAFIQKAAGENLEAYVVAEVTEEARMVMRYDGTIVADLSRAFLSSNGAEKTAEAEVLKHEVKPSESLDMPVADRLQKLVSDLRYCSQQGLVERFDSTIGSGSVLIPYGGKTQKTPTQVMAALLPVFNGKTTTCSVMSFGYDPYLSEQNPYIGAKAAVVTSVAKLVAAGSNPDEAYLTFQEYFERLNKEPQRWGKPLSALLGALDAQMELELAAIGGKDSMSGSFNDLDVPPTLISFAIAPCDARQVISPEFKTLGNTVVLFKARDDLRETKRLWQRIFGLISKGVIVSAWAVTDGGPAEGLFKMALGNHFGFEASPTLTSELLFSAPSGSIIAEITAPVPEAVMLGHIVADSQMTFGSTVIQLDELESLWEGCLEGVFPTKAAPAQSAQAVTFTGKTTAPTVFTGGRSGKPRAVITAFPGTNCENDTARAVSLAGGLPDIRLIRNLTPSFLEESVDAVAAAIKNSQMIILPGGFSGGDEPDGSAKFITAFFRNLRIKEAVHEMLYQRDGLMLGICNGFQALVKLGLVPYGEIRDTDDTCPTLTYNVIGRHQSKYVFTRVASNSSPWLRLSAVGDVHVLPISHGEGRFVASDSVIKALTLGGQIATQYCSAAGDVLTGIETNPNGSAMAIEGITSPDGRVFGKMCHTERVGDYVAKNIYGNKLQPVFESGIKYFM